MISLFQDENSDIKEKVLRVSVDGPLCSVFEPSLMSKEGEGWRLEVSRERKERERERHFGLLREKALRV